MVTAVLRVDFQPYTSYDWLVEKMTEQGFSMVSVIDTYGFDRQFVIGSTLNGYYALVGISDERKSETMRDLQLITRITRMRELDTRGA